MQAVGMLIAVATRRYLVSTMNLTVNNEEFLLTISIGHRAKPPVTLNDLLRLFPSFYIHYFYELWSIPYERVSVTLNSCF